MKQQTTNCASHSDQDGLSEALIFSAAESSGTYNLAGVRNTDLTSYWLWTKLSGISVEFTPDTNIHYEPKAPHWDLI